MSGVGKSAREALGCGSRMPWRSCCQQARGFPISGPPTLFQRSKTRHAPGLELSRRPLKDLTTFA